MKMRKALVASEAIQLAKLSRSGRAYRRFVGAGFASLGLTVVLLPFPEVAVFAVPAAALFVYGLGIPLSLLAEPLLRRFRVRGRAGYAAYACSAGCWGWCHSSTQWRQQPSEDRSAR